MFLPSRQCCYFFFICCVFFHLTSSFYSVLSDLVNELSYYVLLTLLGYSCLFDVTLFFCNLRLKLYSNNVYCWASYKWAIVNWMNNEKKDLRHHIAVHRNQNMVWDFLSLFHTTFSKCDVWYTNTHDLLLLLIILRRIILWLWPRVFSVAPSLIGIGLHHSVPQAFAYERNGNVLSKTTKKKPNSLMVFLFRLKTFAAIQYNDINRRSFIQTLLIFTNIPISLCTRLSIRFDLFKKQQQRIVVKLSQ